MGGVAKGWAIDRMVKRLQDNGYTDIFFDWGGDIKACGCNADEAPWIAGLFSLQVSFFPL